jgi:hypothetical protein
MSLKSGGLHEKHAVATWNLGTVSAFALKPNRWPKRIMTRSPEGRRPEMKWERELERVMKQKNLTPEGAVIR